MEKSANSDGDPKHERLEGMNVGGVAEGAVEGPASSGGPASS
jgi:hypothetical protein